MVRGSIAAAVPGREALWRLLAASLLAAFVLSSSGWSAAQACPAGTKSHHAAAQHKLKSNDIIGKHVVMAAVRAAVSPVAFAGHRCGGSSSTADSSCKAGCCSAGVAMTDPGRDGLADVHLPASYNARVQGRLTSIQPPAHFRPPQFMV
jgi:hypothetical protein